MSREGLPHVRGVPSQVWLGGYPIPGLGGHPISGQGGTQATPQPRPEMGYPLPIPGMGYPLPRPGTGYPPT